MRFLARWLRGRHPAAPLPAELAYRLWARSYADDNPLQRLETEALQSLLPDCRGSAVLDVGCGRGRWWPELRRRGASSILGCDAVLAMLVHVAARPRLVGRLPELPVRQGAFDVVLCTLVLGHLRDGAGALQALTAALRPGGVLLLSDFHPEATRRGWNRTFVDPGGVERAIEQHLHPLPELRDAIAAAGLAVEALEERTWRRVPVVYALRARMPG